MTKAKHVQIKWVKSSIGYNRRQRATLRGLGLRRLQQSVTLQDTPAVRGMIHAGAKGNRSAFICALDLSANQLRIADEISATLKPQKDPKPEVASINSEGRLQAELWHTG